MKDLGKQFGENENNDLADRENKPYSTEGANNDDKNVKNLEEGIPASEKEFSDKKENNESKEEGIAQKISNPEKEGEADKENDRVSDAVGQANDSSTYEPPYYVPNFTVAGTPPPPIKKKKKKRFGVVALIVGAAILSFAIFVGLFALTIALKNRFDMQNINMGNEELPIIQNAPQLNIEQNTDTTYEPKSLPEVVSKVANSVVEIRTSSTEYFGQYVTSGAGSGVIVTQSDKAGYLLTNYHVVYGEDGNKADDIIVVLNSGEEYSAQLIGSDQSIDLALLRIEKKKSEKFTVANFATSSNLVVGQDVIAIGNPLGSLGGTVTDGIISALDRRVMIGDVTMVLLQHNAAINPGNSGGGLFDMMGNLVGIVNAKSSDIGIEGLGFAIPSDIAVNFLNRVMVLEPAIGIRAKYLRRGNTMGVFVVESINESFKLSDKIISINGNEINSITDYYAVVDSLKIGDTATFVIRRNGTDHTVSVTLKH